MFRTLSRFWRMTSQFRLMLIANAWVPFYNYRGEARNVTNFSPLLLGRFLRFWRFCGNIFSRSRIFRWQKNQAFCYAPAQFGTNFGCLLYSIPLFHRLVFYFRETRHFREKRGGAQQVVNVRKMCFLGAQKKNTQIHLVCELMDRAELTSR